MDIFNTEIFLDGFQFTEGLRWHNNNLWFCDLGGNTVYCFSATGQLITKIRWSRYLVIDFSHPLLKSTRQRAKYQGRDCPASVNVCSERAKRLPPTMTLRPDIDFFNIPSG